MLRTLENTTLSMKLQMQKNILLTILMTVFALNGFSNATYEDENHKKAEEEFNAGEMIMHHISDAHEVHFLSTGDFHLSLPLPIIIWGNDGLEVFSSSNFYHNKVSEHGHEYFKYKNYILAHEHIYYANEAGGLDFDETHEIANAAPLDLSLTKTVLGLLLTGLIILLIFTSVAKAYKRRRGQAPKGLQNLMETLIIFIRDEVAIPSIGAKKADKFMPFLLTTFFFIWVANLLGLIPFLGGLNVMGTMSVTIVLALIVFIITTVNGNGHYWSHILWPSGVPLPIKFILIPIEFAGIFIKPAVLMIRLTANITAGHIIILAFTALIFIFGAQSEALGYGVGVGSVLFMIFMNVIELLVAFLQAYVFTLLAAIYFGSAMEEAHH